METSSTFLSANSIWKLVLKYEWCLDTCSLQFRENPSYLKKTGVVSSEHRPWSTILQGHNNNENKNPNKNKLTKYTAYIVPHNKWEIKWANRS